jgi:hypothetical protein
MTIDHPLPIAQHASLPIQDPLVPSEWHPRRSGVRS